MDLEDLLILFQADFLDYIWPHKEKQVLALWVWQLNLSSKNIKGAGGIVCKFEGWIRKSSKEREKRVKKVENRQKIEGRSFIEISK